MRLNSQVYIKHKHKVDKYCKNQEEIYGDYLKKKSLKKQKPDKTKDQPESDQKHRNYFRELNVFNNNSDTNTKDNNSTFRQYRFQESTANTAEDTASSNQDQKKDDIDPATGIDNNGIRISTYEESVNFCKRYNHKMLITDNFQKSAKRALLFLIRVLKKNVTSSFDKLEFTRSTNKYKDLILIFDSTGFDDRNVVNGLIAFLTKIPKSNKKMDYLHVRGGEIIEHSTTFLQKPYVKYKTEFVMVPFNYIFPEYYVFVLINVLAQFHSKLDILKSEMKPKLYWMNYGFNKPNFNYAKHDLDLHFVLTQGLLKNNEMKLYSYFEYAFFEIWSLNQNTFLLPDLMDQKLMGDVVSLSKFKANTANLSFCFVTYDVVIAKEMRGATMVHYFTMHMMNMSNKFKNLMTADASLLLKNKINGLLGIEEERRFKSKKNQGKNKNTSSSSTFVSTSTNAKTYVVNRGKFYFERFKCYSEPPMNRVKDEFLQAHKVYEEYKVVSVLNNQKMNQIQANYGPIIANCMILVNMFKNFQVDLATRLIDNAVRKILNSYIEMAFMYVYSTYYAKVYGMSNSKKCQLMDTLNADKVVGKILRQFEGKVECISATVLYVDYDECYSASWRLLDFMRLKLFRPFKYTDRETDIEIWIRNNYPPKTVDRIILQIMAFKTYVYKKVESDAYNFMSATMYNIISNYTKHEEVLEFDSTNTCGALNLV